MAAAQRQAKFEVKVLAVEDRDDPGLDLGTVVIDAPTPELAEGMAHEELWDDRLGVTCFPRFLTKPVPDIDQVDA